MKEIISGSFEWDAEKNRANKEKHGIGFEEAIKAFEEPYLRVLSRYPTETRCGMAGTGSSPPGWREDMNVKSTKTASAGRREAGKKISDAEIEAAVAADPDWAEFEPIDWSKAEVVTPPKKQAISIRLDQDLIDYFKAQGPGYQRRINAVLRSYMQQRKTG